MAKLQKSVIQGTVDDSNKLVIILKNRSTNKEKKTKAKKGHFIFKKVIPGQYEIFVKDNASYSNQTILVRVGSIETISLSKGVSNTKSFDETTTATTTAQTPVKAKPVKRIVSAPRMDFVTEPPIEPGPTTPSEIINYDEDDNWVIFLDVSTSMDWKISEGKYKGERKIDVATENIKTMFTDSYGGIFKQNHTVEIILFPSTTRGEEITRFPPRKLGDIMEKANGKWRFVYDEFLNYKDVKRPRGGTPLWYALTKVMPEYHTKNRSRFIIITDGDDTTSPSLLFGHKHSTDDNRAMEMAVESSKDALASNRFPLLLTISTSERDDEVNFKFMEKYVEAIKDSGLNTIFNKDTTGDISKSFEVITKHVLTHKALDMLASSAASCHDFSHVLDDIDVERLPDVNYLKETSAKLLEEGNKAPSDSAEQVSNIVIGVLLNNIEDIVGTKYLYKGAEIKWNLDVNSSIINCVKHLKNRISALTDTRIDHMTSEKVLAYWADLEDSLTDLELLAPIDNPDAAYEITELNFIITAIATEV